MARPDARLMAMVDALDAAAPGVRCKIRHFPEGQPYLRLTASGSHSILFAQEDCWVCLSSDRSGTTRQGIVGDVSESPQTVIGRLGQAFGSGRSSSRRLRSLGQVGAALVVAVLAAGAGGAVLAMAVPGAPYGTTADTVRFVITVLAVTIGIAAGGWALHCLRATGDRHPGGR